MEHSRSTRPSNHLWTKQTWLAFSTMQNIPGQCQIAYKSYTQLQTWSTMPASTALADSVDLFCSGFASTMLKTPPYFFQVYASLIITLNEAKSAGTLGHFQFHEFHEFHEQTSKAVQRIRPGQRWRSIAARTFGIRLNHAKSMMVKAWKDIQWHEKM